MESLNCNLCKDPTFLCECDCSWKEFDSLKGLGKTDSLNGVVYSDLSISTMTVCFNFNQYVNLKILQPLSNSKFLCLHSIN